MIGSAFSSIEWRFSAFICDKSKAINSAVRPNLKFSNILSTRYLPFFWWSSVSSLVRCICRLNSITKQYLQTINSTSWSHQKFNCIHGCWVHLVFISWPSCASIKLWPRETVIGWLRFWFIWLWGLAIILLTVCIECLMKTINNSSHILEFIYFNKKLGYIQHSIFDWHWIIINFLNPIVYIAISGWLTTNIDLCNALWKMFRIWNFFSMLMPVERSVANELSKGSFSSDRNIEVKSTHLRSCCWLVSYLLDCPPSHCHIIDEVSSKLSDEIIPIVHTIRHIDSRSKVFFKFNSCKKVNWKLIGLALSCSMS